MSNYYPPPGPPPIPNSTLAIVSLVSGILGWTLVPVIGSIAAIITGHMAKNEIQQNPGSLGGGGMATAGLILGYVSLALGVCACVVFVLPLIGLSFAIPFMDY